MAKTIKITDKVHKELKIFIATVEKETIEEVSSYAIMEYLRQRGHKFIKPPKSK